MDTAIIVSGITAAGALLTVVVQGFAVNRKQVALVQRHEELLARYENSGWHNLPEDIDNATKLALRFERLEDRLDRIEKP